MAGSLDRSSRGARCARTVDDDPFATIPGDLRPRIQIGKVNRALV
jgi:hypothetical protein